jgi:predicted phosphohydrolase
MIRNVSHVAKVDRNGTKVQQSVWIAYQANTKQKKVRQIVPTVLLAQHPPPLPTKTSVAYVAKAVLNETKVQQSVWIAYRENTKQKKGGQIVPTVLLAQHPPPLPTKNNVAHVAKAAINEQKVQQSV